MSPINISIEIFQTPQSDNLTVNPINLPLSEKNEAIPASDILLSNTNRDTESKIEASITPLDSKLGDINNGSDNGEITLSKKDQDALVRLRKEDEKMVEVINNYISTLNESSEENKQEISNILNRFSNEVKSDVYNQRFDDDLTNVLNQYQENLSFLTERNDIFSPLTNIATSPVTETVNEFTNIDKTNITSPSNTLNVTGETKNEVIKTDANFNIEETQEVLNQYINTLSGLQPQTRLKSQELEKSIKIETQPIGLITPAEIPAVQTVQSQSVQKTITTEPIKQTDNSQIVYNEPATVTKTITATEKEKIESRIQSIEQSQSPTTQVINDFTVLEKRLKRIEELLSSPLIVKMA